MGTPASFIVLGPMAFFDVPAYDLSEFNPDECLAAFLNQVREYGRFTLTPVLVDWGVEARRTGWSMEPEANGVVRVSAPGSLYQLNITDPTLGASALSDCIAGMRALMYEQAKDEYVLVPLAGYKDPETRKVPIEVIKTAYRETFDHDAGYIEPEPMFDVRSTHGADWDERLWKMVAAVAGNDQAVYAALFLRAAFADLLFRGDDFRRALQQPDEIPNKIREAVEVENSIHNCYKVIEAVYGGELPKDIDLAIRRFKAKGIDLTCRDEFYGAGDSEPWSERLVRLRMARDDRAAHGRIHAKRKSTYYELMSYQVLATHVLTQHIAHSFPQVALLQ